MEQEKQILSAQKERKLEVSKQLKGEPFKEKDFESFDFYPKLTQIKKEADELLVKINGIIDNFQPESIGEYKQSIWELKSQIETLGNEISYSGQLKWVFGETLSKENKQQYKNFIAPIADYFEKNKNLFEQLIRKGEDLKSTLNIINETESRLKQLEEQLNEKKDLIQSALSTKESQMSGIGYKILPGKRKEKQNLQQLKDEINNFIASEISDEKFKEIWSKAYELLSKDNIKLLQDINNLKAQLKHEQGFLEGRKEKEKQIKEEIYPQYLSILSEFKKILEQIPLMLDKWKSYLEEELKRQRFFDEVVLPSLELDRPPEKEEGDLIEPNESLEHIKSAVKRYFQYFARYKDVNPRDLTFALEQDLKKVKKSFFIGLNVSGEKLVKILKSEKFLSLWEMSEEEKYVNAKGISVSSYLYDRSNIEKKLGIYERKPVYAALCSDNFYDQTEGPAPNFGDFVVVFKKGLEKRLNFVIGDSMNYIFSLIEPIKSKNIEDKFNNPLNRQLNFRHALLAKALYDNFFKNNLRDRRRLEFIEAQILDGVSLEDIDEVRHPNLDKVDSEIKKLLAEHNIALNKTEYINYEK